MKILARYISTIFLKNYLLAAVGLAFLFVFQKLMSDMLDQNFTLSKVVIYNFMDFPEVFVRMTPPSIMMATVLTLSGLGRTNELTACYSIGVGLRHLMIVILSLVFIVACFTLVLQDRILPPLHKNQTIFFYREMKGRKDFSLDVRRDKIWYRSENLIYNLKSFDPETKTIVGMTVYTFDESFRLRQVVVAERARFEKTKWDLKDGSVTVFSGSEDFPMTKRFKHKNLVIKESPKDFQEIEKETEGMRLKEFWAYIERVGGNGVDTKGMEVSFWQRISMSFMPLVMCFLAIPFSIRQSRDGGKAKDLGVCLAVTFFYWLFYSVGLSLGTNGALPPWLAAWLPSLIFMAVAVALISYRRAH